jgi:Protein of unknown function (DUF3112)
MRPPPGPPYASTVALTGGLPTVAVDVPISAVLMALFVMLAAGHMTLFQINRRRDHKFLVSAVMFGFCMARISTLAMRIAWAAHPTNVPVAIAANVLVAAGVVLLFLVDLIFAQRIVRALHPNVGWHPWFSRVFRLFYVLLGVSLVLLITLTVITFYTLDSNLRRVARDIQLYGQSAFLLLCVLPLPLVLTAALVPHQWPVEKFGSGRFRTKVFVLLFASTILTLGAAFRLGTNSLSPRPLTNPAWYQSRACFYCFNFVIEIIVVLTYLVARIDRRFHIPNGAKGPGDYRQPEAPVKESDTWPSSIPETSSEHDEKQVAAVEAVDA